MKLIVKAIIIYFGLAFTAFSVLLAIFGVTSVAEDERDKQLPSRLKSIEYSASRNDYAWLAEYMEIDMDYEEEFEPYWERAIMHEAMLRYRIFEAASDAGLGEEFDEEAEKYEELLWEYCEEPVYERNVPYGEYFLELSGYQTED